MLLMSENTQDIATQILDGNTLASNLIQDYKTQLDKLNQNAIQPKLSMILIGDNPASLSYITKKKESCQKAGLNSEVINLASDINQSQLQEKLTQLSSDPATHGILVQLPLPEQLSVPLMLKHLNPRKDVDGFHAYNTGKLFRSAAYEKLAPCTPKGVIKLLEHYQIPIQGQHVVVVGHSDIVGKPMGMMFLNRNATVTICHKFTKDLASHTKQADILVSAVGKKHLITKDMVKPGAVLVDIGFSKEGKKIYGDIDFQALKGHASAISPVPGGAGPMTVAVLIENTINAYLWWQKHDFMCKNELTA
jgi:methylenetetrahydrofolate dehydrogenase (NADP+) / methenyltetrahydrofolate cyclohydrolase